MAILAIDTSSRYCVLGIRSAEETYVDETELGRSHSQEILPRIEALLAESGISKSQLDLLTFGQGPGSFTGLRIGIGVVQGLAYGLNIPVVGISSLACLAQQAVKSRGQAALVALTARNSEVFFGAYQWSETGIELIGSEGVFEAAEIPKQDPSLNWTGVGNGWALADALQAGAGLEVSSMDVNPRIRAADLIDLGEIAAAEGKTTDAASALPEYLRETVATPNPKTYF